MIRVEALKSTRKRNARARARVDRRVFISNLDIEEIERLMRAEPGQIVRVSRIDPGPYVDRFVGRR